jgi:hypothetical protein
MEKRLALDPKKDPRIDLYMARFYKSIVYHVWRHNNLGPNCEKCVELVDRNKLHVHHITSVRAFFIKLLELYGWHYETAYAELIRRHSIGEVSGVTLCEEHHKAAHNGTLKNYVNTINEKVLTPEEREDWVCMPRILPYSYGLSTRCTDPNSLGYIGMQLTCGLGWHIMTEMTHGAYLCRVNTRHIASLLNKNRDSKSSFEKSAITAYQRMEDLGILAHYWRKNGIVEVQFTKRYIRSITENPWFIRLCDVANAKNSLELALRIELSYKGGRKSHSIKIEKLAKRLNMTSRPDRWPNLIRKACKNIPWASVVDIYVKGASKIVKFDLEPWKRGPTPIHTLRESLKECIVKVIQ